ncbi:hypothetical protein DMENIID0001_077230 [Sergentomyia squamirostris]
MTTRWRQKVTFAAAVVLLIVALGLGIFVWTAVSNGVFSPRHGNFRHRINISDNQESSSVNRSSLGGIRGLSNGQSFTLFANTDLDLKQTLWCHFLVSQISSSP